LIGATAQLGVTWATALPSGVALRVGDESVTEDDFRQRVDVLEALYGVRAPEDAAARDRFRRDAAKSIAVSIVLDRAAAEQKVTVADKSARDALDKIVETYLPEGRDALTAFLGSQGISEADVLDEVKRQLVTSRLLEKVTGDVEPVTDAEVRSTYDKRRQDMVTPERRHLRNIVVDSEQKATELAEQAKSGAGFAQLAAENSMDESTADKGGDLGTLTRAELDKAFADAAFAAKKGSLFGPVKTQYGWNVGYVVGVQPERPLSFEQAAEQLERELNDKAKLDVWRAWLANEIKAADVEYAEAYRPADPDAPPAETPATAPPPR